MHRDQRKPPGDEHRATDRQAVGDDERRAETRADDVCKRAESGEREQRQERHGQRREEHAAPVVVGALEIVADPRDRLVARLQDPRQRALWLRRRRRRRADAIEQPAVGEISDQPRQPPRPGRPDDALGLGEQLGDRPVAVEQLEQRRVVGVHPHERATLEISQDEPLDALIGGESLQRPARPHAGPQPTVQAQRRIRRGAQAHQRRVDRHDDRLAGTARRARGPARRSARPARGGAGASAATPMNTSPTRICAPGNSRVGPSTALPESDRPKPRASILDHRPLGTETDTRVHARDGLVGDPDACLLAAADRQRPADRHARAVGQQRARAAGLRWARSCRHVSHRATTAARPGCRRSWRSPSESRRDCGC